MINGIPLIGYWKRESNPTDEVPYKEIFDRIGLFYFNKGFYFEGEYLWDMKKVREKVNYVKVFSKRNALLSLEDFLKRIT